MKIKQIYNDYKWAFRCFGFILILALLCLPLHWIEPYVKFQLTPLALEWFGFCEARFLFIVHYVLMAALCVLCWWVQHQTSNRWIQLPARFFYIFPGIIAYKVATAFSFNSSYILVTPFFIILRVWHRAEVQMWLDEALWRAQKRVSPEEYKSLLEAILAEGCDTKATIQQCILKHVYATVDPSNSSYWDYLMMCIDWAKQDPLLSATAVVATIIIVSVAYRVIIKWLFGDDGGDDSGSGGDFPFFPDDFDGGDSGSGWDSDSDNSPRPKPPSSKIDIKAELKDFNRNAPPVELRDAVLGNVQPPSTSSATTNLPTATPSTPVLIIRSLQGVEPSPNASLQYPNTAGRIPTKLPTFLDSDNDLTPPATPKESTDYSKLSSVKQSAPTITIEKRPPRVEFPLHSETVESPSPEKVETPSFSEEEFPLHFETVESPSPEKVETPSFSEEEFPLHSETVETSNTATDTANPILELADGVPGEILATIDSLIIQTPDSTVRVLLTSTQYDMSLGIVNALKEGTLTTDILTDILQNEEVMNPIIDYMAGENGAETPQEIEKLREEIMDHWLPVLAKASRKE